MQTPALHREIFQARPMPLVDLSQWHALLLSPALIWAGVPPTVRVQAPAEVTDAFAAALAEAGL